MKRSKLRWALSILGLLAIAVLVWFVGPLVSIAGYEPLVTDFARMLLILIIVVLWLLNVLRQVITASRANNQIAEGLTEAASEVPEEVAERERSAEEVTALRERFDEALQVLKQSRGKGAGNLYELPWYIIIGPPGAGKTTALVNSGLQFPLAERFGKGAIQGVGGTRNCDWWFTNDAVLLDTAGRYVTQDSDRVTDSAAWEGFLRLLKRHRRRRPLHGVLVAISLSDLMLQSEAERDAHVSAIRGRVQELYKFFGIRFPIYVLFSKCDLVAGFTEFFDDLGREERAQVWGVSFPIDEAEPVQRFGEEYDALLGRLNDRLLWRMDQERDPMRRCLIYGFPQQMATLKDTAVRFIQDAFQASRFDAPPLVRGVYFTSGTQEGTPIDRILGAVARSFGIDYQSVSTFGEPGRSYFITNLLRDVVVGESGLVGTNRRFERQRAWFQRGAYVLALLLTVGIVSAWSTSYTRNLQLVTQMEEKVAAYNASAADIPEAVESFDQLLPALETLRETTTVFEQHASAVPWYMKLGMYQGEKLGSGARDAYLRELRNGFLPLLVSSIARRITGGNDDPDFLYTGLKTYLMLGQTEYLDPDLLKAWMSVEWQQIYGEDVRTQDKLHGHLDTLLAGRGEPAALDEAVIASVRRRLTLVPLHELLYGRLMRDSSTQQTGAFRLSDALGAAGSTVFSRASGKSLEAPIPALFTYRGYYETYKKESLTLLATFRKESWVLGIKGDEYGERELKRLDERLDALYVADYVRNWKRMLADLRVTPFRSVAHGIEVLEVLSGRRSPLRALLDAVKTNTSLTVLPAGLAAVAGKVEGGALGATKDRLRKLMGGDDEKTEQAPRSPAAAVQAEFEELNAVVSAKEGGEPPIGAIIELLAKVYSHMDAIAAGEQGEGTALSRLKREAVAQPEPLKGWLRQLVVNAESITDRKAATESAKELAEKRRELLNKMNAAWKSKVLPMCTRAMVDRYPIYADAQREMTVRDFGLLFGPGGLIDDFFAKHLQPFVDTSGRRWEWQAADEISLNLPGAVLESFTAAAEIRDTFFNAGGLVPSVEFSLKPVDLDSSVTQFNLDLEGQKFDYRHGPSRPQRAKWPMPDGTSQVRMFFEGKGGERKSYVKDGPWAWFRFLDEAEVEPVTAERMLVTFQSDGRKARYEIIANSVINPFLMQSLSQYRCPQRF